MPITREAPPEAPSPEVAKVDYLVDENGAPVELDEDEGLRITHDADQTVGATGPTNAMRYVLFGVAVMAVVLIVMQIVSSQPG